MTPSLQHTCLASLSASSLISIPLWPRTQGMYMRESLFPSRNSRVSLEKRMEKLLGWMGVCEGDVGDH